MAIIFDTNGKIDSQASSKLTKNLNKKLLEWGNEAAKSAAALAKSLVKKDENLSNSIVASLKRKKGQTEGIRLTFAREGIFIIKGAGRGYATASSKNFWSQKMNLRVATKEKSKGKAGTDERQEKDWLNPVLQQEIPKLNEIFAENVSRNLAESINQNKDIKVKM